MTRPSGDVWSRSQHPPEQAELGVGLRAVEAARDVGQRRAGRDERRRHGERARRGVGMGEGRRVHDDPGHQRGRERAVAEVERDAEPGREQRHHLARRGRAGLDPVGRARRVVRGVVVDDHARQRREQLGVPLGDRADALRAPQSDSTSRS